MCEHAAALRAAENDLATHRQRHATLTAWLHNPTHDLTARTALAQLLELPAPADTPTRRFTPNAHNLKADEYHGIPVIELDGDQVIAITDDINRALNAITSYGNDHDWAHINITADRLRSEWVAFEWQPEDAEYEWLTLDAEPGDDKAVHTYRLPY
ncbi:hypothetical protein ACF06T_30615 [Streptomyces albidoflavus]